MNPTMITKRRFQFGASQLLKTTLALCLTLACLFIGSPASAAVDVCYSGGKYLPNFTINGDGYLNGSDILVTRNTGGQRTSVMYNTPLSTSGDIHIKYVINISAGADGADGMAFVMHNDPNTYHAIGTAGGGIGYETISPSVVVEFDTYTNSGDPNGNHVALTLNGVATHNLPANSGMPVNANPGITLESGSNIYVWIDYVASSTALSVYMSTSDSKPGTTTLSATIDVASKLGSQMYLGFTGSTGGSMSQHEIVALYASDTGAAGAACCSTNSDCASSPLGPVCDPVKHICGPCSSVESQCQGAAKSCDVSGAVDTCVDQCGGNYGSSATNACTNVNFKSCSTSGTTAGNCVSCNGDSNAGSALAYRCPSGAPVCADNGFCSFCTTNADCTAGAGHAGKVCDTSTGRCGCSSNSDCDATSAGPTCLAGNVCGCSADSQCGNGQFCSNSVCVSKLAIGAAIPNDSLHGGTCSVANGSNVCLSGLCNTSTNTCAGPNATTSCTAANQCATNICGSNGKCGLADFAGTCSSVAQCQSGICGVSQVCLAADSCWGDGDCASGKFCDRANKVCTDKLGPGTAIPNDGALHLGSCDSAGAVCASGACNTTQKTCAAANGVACSGDSQCVVNICGSNGLCGIADYEGACVPANGATLCQSGACSIGEVCMQSTDCYVDSDCSATQYCERSSHTCRTKLGPGQAVPSDTLHDGTCSSASAVCAAGLSCNTVAKTCAAANEAQCSSTEQCVSNICGTNGLCGLQLGGQGCTVDSATAVCQSGTCSATAQTCIPSSNGCGSDADCAAGTYCDGLSYTCKSKLPAGSPVPNDGLHDGSCSSASAVCTAGLSCNPQTRTCAASLGADCTSPEECVVDVCGSGKCGIATGQSGCTTNTATTLCQSGFCGAISGVCVSSANGCANDADCSSDQYCDAATWQCTNKLAAGTALPTDALHDGQCPVSNTAVACASGLCNTAKNTCAASNSAGCAQASDCVANACGANSKCGLADGEAGCASETATVVCQSGVCAASGTCVPPDGCFVDSDCTATQYCDRANLTCHAKLSKGDAIPEDGLHSGTCTTTDAQATCQSGLCNPQTNTCAEANGGDCGNDNQCLATVCGSNGKCGLAAGDSGCVASNGVDLCQSGNCSPSGVCIPTNTACWMDSDCASGQYCDRSNNTCVGKLGVGKPIPADGLHDGRCSVGIAAIVCATGLCNIATDTCANVVNSSCSEASQCTTNACGANGICGLADGQGPCSEATAALCQSGTCGAQSNTCIPKENGCSVDAECPTGRYCNPASMTCVATLSAGAGLPKDALHSGACSPALAAAVCSSGACNSTTNTCSEPNGSACQSAAQCTNNQCGTNGLCGLANRQTGCTVATQVKDCQSAACGSTGSCIPAGGCAKNSDCAAGQYCNDANQACVAKLAAGTVLPAGVCSASVAQSLCATGQCNATTATCSSPNQQACQSNKDCTTGVCGSNHLCGLSAGDGPCNAGAAESCQSGICGSSSHRCIASTTGCNLDSDCKTGEYCAGAALGCKTKSSSGTTLPVDSEHTGLCTPELAALACQSGKCNSVTNTCAVASGVECTAARDCVANVCAANGKCGIPNGIGGCGTGTANTCQSGNCSLDGVCVPARGCHTKDDCRAASFCDTSSLNCLEKLVPGATLPSGVCNAASAKEQCTSGECNGVTNTCASPLGSQCKSNSECTTNACDPTGKCVTPPVCSTPNCLAIDSRVEGGGCSVSHRGGSHLGWLIAAGAMLVWRSRRRRFEN